MFLLLILMVNLMNLLHLMMENTCIMIYHIEKIEQLFYTNLQIQKLFIIINNYKINKK